MATALPLPTETPARLSSILPARLAFSPQEIDPDGDFHDIELPATFSALLHEIRRLQLVDHALREQRGEARSDCARAQQAWRAQFDENRDLCEKLRELESRNRDLEAGISSARLGERLAIDADGSGRRKAEAQVEDLRDTLRQILSGHAGKDCPSCEGDEHGCEDCDFLGVVAR